MSDGRSPVRQEAKLPKPQHRFKDPAKVPLPIQMALRDATILEKVPLGWFDDLLWIMAQESEGKIGIRNNQGSTARGLFQFMEINYSLLPNGEASFGNAVEECQGGIYVTGRFHTAAAARRFWEKNLWY